MSDTISWRKRLAIWRNRLYLYPAPEAMPRTRLFWLAMGLVTLAATIFSVFYISIHLGRQDAFLTPAEDLGTMDQAIWSIAHGLLPHQTICNIVSDTNCYSLNGISRFSIHFEPILFPIALLYLLVSGPKTLLILQTLVVASGAFPAFWLARLRLRNEFAAVGIACLYLLYPAQQQAEIFDFHAVTLTAALLLFTLYFMYTRRTLWLFVFAILSMACKEEIPLTIAFFGLWMMLFQQRVRVGLALALLAVAWVGMTLLVYHFASPTGHPLLASRYAYLGSGPLSILKNVALHPLSLIRQHVLEHEHRQYLRILLAPAGYLPALAPWALVLAVPELAINLLSSDRNQYIGVFQYNAAIVPILIFSTIEAIVLITWFAQWLMRRWQERQAHSAQAAQAQTEGQAEQKTAPRSGIMRWAQPAMLFLLICFTLFMVLREDVTYGAMPFSRAFGWPHVMAHDRLAQRFIDLIPATASVSAQSSIVPHISERASIYLFPYGDNVADYIFLDITSFTYPYEPPHFTQEVKRVLLDGSYGVVVAQDGYLLLKHNLPAPGISPNSPVQTGSDVVPNLPDSFCSFTLATPQEVQHPLRVDFTPGDGSSVSLIGYSVAPPSAFLVGTRQMSVTAYWRVGQGQLPPLHVLTVLNDARGKEVFSSIGFPAISWCPTSSWKPGSIVRTVSSVMYIGNAPLGLAQVGLALLPFATPFGTMRTVTDRLPLHIVSAPAGVSVLPGSNTVQIDSFTIVP